jgi:lysophospholipase L1-like esterase
MNSNSTAKTILCYGDSNTFGQRSDDVTKGRWPADTRWTGRLQQLLGDDYYIIEEGLSSRTTNIDYAQKPGRNGRTYLTSCLQSHHPLDLVVLMLGTNDLKDEFNRSAKAVARAVQQLVLDIQKFVEDYNYPTKILVVSPIYIDDTATHFTRLYDANYSHGSVLKSHELAGYLEETASTNNCAFFNAASVALPGEDGIHLSHDSHEALAQALSQCAMKLFN